MDRTELIEFALKDLNRLDRILFEETGNPLYVWDVIGMFRAWKRPIPEWCQEYLDGFAERILASGDKQGRFENRIRSAVDVEPAHFAEFFRAERISVSSGAISTAMIYDEQGNERDGNDFLGVEGSAALVSKRKGMRGTKSLITDYYKRREVTANEQYAFHSRNYLYCQLREEMGHK